MRVLTWNLERRKVEITYGKLATNHLFFQAPDVMAITETRTNFPKNDGHTIWAQHPNGHFDDDERKVLLWSKTPWSDVDDVGDENLPVGRFISGITESRIGKIRVVGICIPYHMADVSHGTKDKKPWEQHIDFLKILPSILEKYTHPIVIAGDFNQRYPLVKYGNKEAAKKMAETFSKYEIVTKGIIDGMSKAGIDHISIDNNLQTKSIWGWPNVIDGTRLSDHDGAGCELVLKLSAVRY